MLRAVLPPPLKKLVESYVRALRPATIGAALTLLFAAVVVAANLGREGTLKTRLAALLLLAAAVLAVAVRLWLQRRWSSSQERAVRSVVISAQPELGYRILRALHLAERVPEKNPGESAELAKLHYERMLARASELAITNTAKGRARRVGGVMFVVFAAAAVAVTLSPLRVLEGLNVLLARKGVAPVEMLWLGPPLIEAHPPPYLRQPIEPLVFESASMMPDGTELVFRAEPLFEGRTLVLTDGRREQPFVDDGSGAVVARWELDSSTQLRVAARFGEVLVYEPRGIELYAEMDRVPEVELAGAPSEVQLEKMERLELHWAASDDHSVVEVELVLRSAGKEERRTLERYAGDKRQANGGYVLFPDDVFLQRVFLPATVRVEARDNDSREGSKWGQSQAITIRPPNVGAPQLQRYMALLELRNRVVDLLAFLLTEAEPGLTERERAAEFKTRVNTLQQQGSATLSARYSGLNVPRGWNNFAKAQLQKLTAVKPNKKGSEAVERIVLALDSALGSLSSREAQAVSKQLANVADEAALAAHGAQGEKQVQDSVERLDLAISVLDRGARELSQLGDLGADLGSVAGADLGRVQRARASNDFFHAELAALHMAARLSRPNPSFGAKGGGGGGVESGSGSGGGSESDAQGETSEAESEFDRMARDLEQLSQEHAEAMDQTGKALREAEQQMAGEDMKAEAKQRAEALRRAVMRLPQPGEAPGTSRASAALAREHTGAMAHELEKLAFEEAIESGRRALSAAEEAQRRGDLDPQMRRELENTLSQLKNQMEWAQEQLQQRNQAMEQAAKEALEKVSGLESELAERARRLSREADSGESLPQESRDRLERAQQLMQEAADKLRGSQGQQGLSLQQQAQRLLEESKPGETEEHAGESPKRGNQEEGGRAVGTGGDVPNPENRNRAEDFRRRVLEGLKKSNGGRLSPAVQRYAEGLLR
jgi:hypothetical protein